MKKFFSFLLVLLFVIGISLVSYPVISNVINELTNSSKYEKYDNSVKTLSQDEKYNIIEKAREYNDMIASDFFNAELSDKYRKVLSQYDKILDFENGIIAYIDIPKINISLPIYHETVKDVLSKGAAHLKNSSFPIGENDSHSIISAHSGYPHAVFFDDLDELQIGDTFTIRLLNNNYIYKVTDIDIVKPEDTEKKLKVVKGKDLVTLITCYPYSINTHRLLVTGERYFPDEKTLMRSPTFNKTSTVINSVIISFILFIFYILILLVRRFKDGKQI